MPASRSRTAFKARFTLREYKRSGKPVLDSIRDGDRLIETFTLKQTHYRSKDLLPGYAHPRSDSAEDRGGKEIALAQSGASQPLSTRQEPGSLLLRYRGVAFEVSTCCWLICGPICTWSSRPSPTLSARARSTSLRVNSAAMLLCTMMRLVAVQR